MARAWWPPTLFDYDADMKQIRLNAFEMNTVGHQSPGLWAHPRDRSADYTDLSYWTGLAQTLGLLMLAPVAVTLLGRKAIGEGTAPPAATASLTSPR